MELTFGILIGIIIGFVSGCLIYRNNPKMAARIDQVVGTSDINGIVARYRPRSILHIGAHYAQEASLYEVCGAEKIVWIEAIPSISEEISKILRPDKHTILTGLVLDRPGLPTTFHLSNHKMGSSSIFSWGEAMKDIFPDIKEDSTIILQSTTISSAKRRVTSRAMEE
ncbi:MAG: hypothetical protein ACE14T_11200 [Syntrophales bacterium]